MALLSRCGGLADVSCCCCRNDHLGLCSNALPDDYVRFDIEHMDHTDHTFQLDPAYKSRHRWEYFPDMSRDEVLLFKQFDSEGSANVRYVFHASFRDPCGLGTRQSIEARCIAFFPDDDASISPRKVSERSIEDAFVKIKIKAAFAEPEKAHGVQTAILEFSRLVVSADTPELAALGLISRE